MIAPHTVTFFRQDSESFHPSKKIDFDALNGREADQAQPTVN